MASCKIESWRANADRISCGRVSQSCVEPSISVNKNVTVPDGSILIRILFSKRTDPLLVFLELRQEIERRALIQFEEICAHFTNVEGSEGSGIATQSLEMIKR